MKYNKTKENKERNKLESKAIVLRITRTMKLKITNKILSRKIILPLTLHP
jgi:hypothetical protein